jgi:predicted acylesterase/phospholipase RssA
MKNVLNLSGGGTRIVGIGAAAINLIQRGYRPDVITGVSAGSYLALPLAMGKHREASQLMDAISADMLTVMFDPSPVNRKGGLTKSAIWNAATGKPYLGKQRKSLEAIRQIVSASDFLSWRTDPASPEVWVLAVDYISGSRIFENLKDWDYEDALSLILASGSIPVYTEAVEMIVAGKRRLMFDGGVRSHIACREILDQYPGSIGQMVSVYSRPKDYRDEKPEDWNMADISTPLFRTFDVVSIENSKSCEWAEEFLSMQRGINLERVFLPGIMTGPYDADPARLRALKQAAVLEAQKLEIRDGRLV